MKNGVNSGSFKIGSLALNGMAWYGSLALNGALTLQEDSGFANPTGDMDGDEYKPVLGVSGAGFMGLMNGGCPLPHESGALGAMPWVPPAP